jgi:hypothetical protein
MVKHGQRCARTKTVWGLLVAGILMAGVSLGSASAPPAGADPAGQAGTGAQASKPAAPSKTAAKKTAAARKAPAKKAPATKSSGAASAAAASPAKEVAGRRDPFRLPPPPTPGGMGPGEQILGPLPPGPRGLLINQLKLEGIVRLDATNTMIAVVDNNANRAYFLRENDAVYDGVVSKITPDSVLFRQNYSEPGGQSGVRDVVKRLSPGPGEGR